MHHTVIDINHILTVFKYNSFDPYEIESVKVDSIHCVCDDYKSCNIMDYIMLTYD